MTKVGAREYRQQSPRSSKTEEAADAYSENLGTFDTPTPELDSMKAALADCDSFGDGRGFFPVAKERQTQALELAYRFFRACDGFEAATVELLRDHPQLKLRRRHLSHEKLALAAIYITFKPQPGKETASCGPYANALIWAKQREVAPDRFVAEFTATTMEACIEAVRGKKPKRKARKRKRRASEYECELVLFSGGQKMEAAAIAITPEQFAVLSVAKPDDLQSAFQVAVDALLARLPQPTLEPMFTDREEEQS